MKLYGLIGYPLSHSFSKRHFSTKFEVEQIKGATYELFPLEQIEDFPTLIQTQSELTGLNVTIPYKQAIFPYLDEVEEEAAAVGAVNTIKFEAGKLIGYNTDVFGFERSLRKLLDKSEEELSSLNALILGTGGAAKAVVYVLNKLDINHKLVSRSESKGDLIYAALDEGIVKSHQLIINTTPLGTFPNVDAAPDLPYDCIGEQHYCYDLVYNPAISLFLKQASEQGAKTMNGLEMLYLQAEKSWSIWNR